MYQTS